MIHVDRSAVPVPATLNGPGSAGAIETEDNQQLAAQGQHAKMKFTAYSTQPVKDALNVLFKRKCGYCESLLRGNQPGDVEHYRPKKKVCLEPVKGKRKEVAGYYWLAADWNNLLLSCADCNRPRVQEMDKRGRMVAGKANWFPIGDESLRASQPQHVQHERRQLLDPCVDDPRQHLEFHENGTVAYLTDMGETTIRVCALDRLELVQARVMQRESADSLIRHILEKLDAKEMPNPLDVADLVKLMGPDRPFSAAIRHVVKAKLGSVFPGP